MITPTVGTLVYAAGSAFSILVFSESSSMTGLTRGVTSYCYDRSFIKDMPVV